MECNVKQLTSGTSAVFEHHFTCMLWLSVYMFYYVASFMLLLSFCETLGHWHDIFLKKTNKKKNWIYFTDTESMNTLTVGLNLGTGTLFVSFLYTLKSIMDWLSSDTAALEPLLWAAAVLCLGWILFMRSLRELKLSDCGNLRIKGFCEKEEQS